MDIKLLDTQFNMNMVFLNKKLLTENKVNYLMNGKGQEEFGLMKEKIKLLKLKSVEKLYNNMMMKRV